MTRVRGSPLRTERKSVVQDTELAEMLSRAEGIANEFLRLRALAVVSLFRLTGKRRGELATLGLEDFKTVEGEHGSRDGFLEVTFTLEKKRKGSVLQKRSTKALPLQDPLTKYVIRYLEYLKGLTPMPRWFLPQCKSVFGVGLVISCGEHVKGRQVFNLIRGLSESVWPHLFRETKASDIVKADPTIIAAFRVQRALDLERYETGFNYLRRYAADVMDRSLGD